MMEEEAESRKLKKVDKVYLRGVGKYRFVHRVKFNIYRDEDRDMVVRDTVLGIEGTGKNYDDALKSYEEALEAAINGYYNEDNKNLTQDAKRLKKLLRELIKR